MTTYDLAVIGGGTAGLTAAVGAAAQGARTVLIERARTGGDCLWTGCVPSKALLTVAAHVHTARHSGHLGVHTDGVSVDFRAAMAHVRRAIAAIEPHDSPERLRREGVEVVAGVGRFVGPDRIEVAGRTIGFRRAMIATGASPVVPDVPSLEPGRVLTTDDVWGLTELPARLVVLGGGPIGVELAQAFARLGSRVTLVEHALRVLPGEEPAASAVVEASLRRDGVELHTGGRVIRAEDRESGRHLIITSGDGDVAVAFDRLLAAHGRRPNVDGLELDRAGVTTRAADGAVVVDRYLRTANPRIYAGGDVTMLLPFTHTASVHGATVVQNALFGLRRQVDHDRIPWVTFTDPEVARVGLTTAQARERYGPRTVVRTAQHRDVDRAIAVGATDGFATLVGDRRGRLVGATVVGPRAGETIGEVVAWMAGGAKLSTIVRSTHAYPTWSSDIADASLEELRASLAKVRWATRGLLWAQRRLVR